MAPHVFAGGVPYGQEDALTFVVARSVLVRLAEVAQGDGSVDGRDDLREVDLFQERLST